MYTIAICDDDYTFIKKISSSIEDFFVSRKITIKIVKFNDGQSIIDYKDNFDILFLDIQMPSLSGYEVAKILSTKLKEENTLLIFCTQFETSVVYKAFDYHPFHFIRKSKFDIQISEVLMMALNKLSIDDKKYYFNYSGKSFSLKSKDIVCFIIFDKGITIYTKNDKHRMFGTLKELEAILDNNYFIRIRSNCIINCEYIKSINNNKIELLDGISVGQNDLTIPRGKIKEIKKKIYNFVILKGEEK